jgi:choline-sulfatase
MGSVRIPLRALLAAVLCALAAAGGCSGAAGEKPRHVVLIVVDTLRADHLSTYGYRRPTSPELDKLAREGAVFLRAVSQGSWTQPSMVSMLTGAYLADEVTKIPPDKTTLAQVFQKHGYATAAFIYNNVLSPESGFHAGFDVFDWQDAPYQPIDKIAAWFEAHKGKRTFTFIHLNEAHDPYDPPGEFDRFVHEKDSVPQERYEFFRKVTQELGLGDYDENVRRINEEIGAYDDDVRYSDDHIGRILAALRATGEWDKTAVVVGADHGEGLWTHVQFLEASRLKALRNGEPPTLHNTLQQTHGSRVDLPLIHVPVVMVAPGMPKGVRVEPWVENVDIGPTLLELCDLARPVGLQGTSLVPLWREPQRIEHQKRGVFTTTRYVSSLIDQDGYQLILPTPRGECEFALVPELYDLRKDPEARVNLAAAEPERVKALSKAVAERLKSGMTASSIVTAGSKAQEEQLKMNGYLAANVVDTIDEKYAKLSSDELLAHLADPQNVNCLVRLRAAMALAQRKLDEPQRATLRAVRQRETSDGIKRIYDEILVAK